MFFSQPLPFADEYGQLRPGVRRSRASVRPQRQSSSAGAAQSDLMPSSARLIALKDNRTTEPAGPLLVGGAGPEIVGHAASAFQQLDGGRRVSTPGSTVETPPAAPNAAQ